VLSAILAPAVDKRHSESEAAIRNSSGELRPTIACRSCYLVPFTDRGPRSLAAFEHHRKYQPPDANFGKVSRMFCTLVFFHATVDRVSPCCSRRNFRFTAGAQQLEVRR